MTDVRRIAADALLLAEEGRAGVNLSGQVLDKYSYLDRQSRNFLKRLIEGTIERRITIDHVLDLYSRTPVRKMKKEVRVLLRMGVYQLLYMDGVPAHAAVSETVRLIRKTPFSNLSGYVNAVLRTVDRNRDKIAWPDRSEDEIRYLSVVYSCPEWIVKKLIGEYGTDRAESLLELSVTKRPVTARVNLSKTTVEEACALSGGVASNICTFAVTAPAHKNITESRAFASGLICIQDISSMLVCLVAGIQKTDIVLDLCAAPGGKALHAADLAVEGRVVACDVSEKKLSLIEENIQRCAFSNIEVRLNDATVFDETMEGMADVVIADVPCSGLGVMGRKNDIKYNLTEDAVDSLVSLQRSILTNAVRYLRPGGRLMFSTCTCSREENEGNRDFLIKECHLKPAAFYDLLPDMLKDDTAHEGYLQLFGKDKLTDGFFLAGFTN